MNARTVLLGGWTEVFQEARAAGLHLTVVQSRQLLVGVDIQATEQLLTAPTDDPSLVEVFAALHRHHPFDSVLSFQEQGVLTAALIREELGLFGNPLRPVELTRDKALMREHLLASEIPSIPFVVTNDVARLRSFAQDEGRPVVLKPRDGSGSRLVHRVDTPQAFDAAVAECLHTDPDVKLMAETFMLGPEVSVEAITWAGRHHILMTTDKQTTGAPYFVETGHTMPSRLSAHECSEVHEMVIEFLTSIGHRYGPSHTELIMTGAGPRIVESHTRLGGDRIFEMVRLTTGYDFIRATLRGFAGTFTAPAPNPSKAAAIRYLTPPPGVVAEIHGLEAAHSYPGVVEVRCELAPGNPIGPVRKSADRSGYVLAVGDTAIQAAKRASAATKLIQVQLTHV